MIAGERHPARVWPARLFRWIALPAGVLWMLSGATPTRAGLGEAPLGGWMSSWSTGPTGAGLTPSMWADRHGLGFAIGGAIDLDLGGGDPADAESPAFSGRHLEIGAASGGRMVDSWGRDMGTLSARLHFARAREGLWLAGAGFETDPASNPIVPLLGAGGWLRRGSFTISTQFVQLLRPVLVERAAPAADAGRDTTGSPLGGWHWKPGPADDVRYLTGAETAVAWSLDRLEIRSRVGVAVGIHHQPTRWGEIGAAYWVRPSWALFASARDVHEVPDALEPTRGTHAAFGLQFAPGRAAETPAGEFASGERPFILERLDRARCRVVLRAAGHHVELSSDATDWQPVSARRVGIDRWEAEMNLAPGIHRIAMRIDGGPWTAPPGLPLAIDEFGGQVGIAIVE